MSVPVNLRPSKVLPISGDENEHVLNITCQDYSWSDVEVLVQPYLNGVLYTALIMQGQNSDYDESIAAVQAMDDCMFYYILVCGRQLTPFQARYTRVHFR